MNYSRDDENFPLTRFESMLKTNDILFFDSSEFENIIQLRVIPATGAEKFAEYINSEFEAEYEDEEISGAAQKALRAFTTNLNEDVRKNKVDRINLINNLYRLRNNK